ncbi:MAG: hypothetical protein R3Y64_11610, partial [Peptostreptococcaceae bacterium]
MKFSWQLTNNFLQIQEQFFETIKNNLILSGIEVEDINELTNDKILDLSITTNRKEINSAFSLAREISSITDKQINIKPIKFHLNQNIKYSSKRKNHTCLQYLRIHTIDQPLQEKLPAWISYQLELQGKYKTHILKNIQEYIKIKWGKTFEIITIDEYNNIISENNIEQYEHLIKLFLVKYINQKKDKSLTLIIFITEQYIEKTHLHQYDINEFFENYYIDSMNNIKELNKFTIGKYYEIHEPHIPKNNNITLEKQTLNNWLGSVNKRRTKFLTREQITKILIQLKFFPNYIKAKKSFTIQVPSYRNHDLINDIDIIEEIGRLYQFKNFYNNYIYNKKIGKKSVNLIKINKIRKTLRDLGINEVINCSLITSQQNTHKPINIYNPITEEQKILRTNIASSLIKNYEYNNKYSNKNLLIFEIGKTFYKNTENNTYIEKKSLGGLIHSKTYNQYKWSEKSCGINLFQMKGIIELFLIKINSKSFLTNITTNKATNDSINWILKKNS